MQAEFKKTFRGFKLTSQNFHFPGQGERIDKQAV